MATETRVHVRWDGKLFPEVETPDLRRFFATFGSVLDLERKNNWKKGGKVWANVDGVVGLNNRYVIGSGFQRTL